MGTKSKSAALPPSPAAVIDDDKLTALLRASPEDYAESIAAMQRAARALLKRAEAMLAFPLAEQQQGVGPDGVTTIVVMPLKGWSASDAPGHIKAAIECLRFAVGFDAALGNPAVQAVLDRERSKAEQAGVPEYEFPGLTENPFGAAGETFVDLPQTPANGEGQEQ